MVLLELLFVSIFVSLSCAIPGNFLILRGNSLTAFALSHSTLFGIVIVFLIIQDPYSPLLFLGAAFIGLVTVWLIENFAKNKLITLDSSLGLIYISIFSIAIILISLFSFPNLTPTSIITGNIATTQFDRLIIGNYDLGPRLLWVSLLIFLANVLFVIINFKELKIAIFDPQLAQIMGFKPAWLHLCFMFLVSLTIVGSFRVAGVILVVGLIVLPPSTAYLISNEVWKMVIISTIIAINCSVFGYLIAESLGNIEPGSSIIIVNGSVFISTILLKNCFLKIKRRKLKN